MGNGGPLDGGLVTNERAGRLATVQRVVAVWIAVLLLAGAVVALIGGFFGTRAAVVAPATTTGVIEE